MVESRALGGSMPPWNTGLMPWSACRAYQLALAAMRLGNDDALARREDRIAQELLGQLVRALASIAANVAEGYSRGSYSDRRRFFEYALGSTREAIVWYHSLAPDELDDRVARLVSIRRLLLTMIRNARATSREDARKFER